MKKHILFVDDESFVLDGLQRMLRSMRGEWAMSFALSGEEALKIMAQTPIDIVVSDMRMPSMNGAELLNLVMQRYPRVIRIILSGHADNELILRCVGSTHQYLSKPCDPLALKKTITRAAQTENTLANENLRSLIGRMTTIPSVPSLYTEIMARTQDPDVELSDVAAIIAKDIGMTANILRLVNSAYFGINRRISNTLEAVAYLGIDTIKSLVLSLNLFSTFAPSTLRGLSLENVWSHSMSVGQFATRIAAEVSGDTKLIQEAFVAGVLHDCGKLILGMNFQQEYRGVMEQAKREHITWVMAERNIFGTDHSAVGGYLLGLWGLPVPMVEAIALHHQPDAVTESDLTPLAAVYIANTLMREAEAGLGIPFEPLDEEYLARLGLESHVSTWRKQPSESEPVSVP